MPKRHTVTHRNDAGYHVVALPHDPQQPDQKAAALVLDKGHAEAVASLLDELTAAGPAATSKRKTAARR